jgi:hypothetical protein
MESWRVIRTVVADSHRFGVEQDPDPHVSFGSGPHLNETLVVNRIKLMRIRKHCQYVYCDVRYFAYYGNSPDVATTIALSTYVYCRSPAYSTACCGKHRLPGVATTIALSAYVYCRSPAYSTACCGKHRLHAVATTIALSAYVYCHSPAYSTACCGKHRVHAVATTMALSAYVLCSPVYSSACCGKHRLPAVTTTIALSAYVLSQPRLLNCVLWQT